MVIKIHPTYIEFKRITETQLDYLSMFGSFSKLYEANGVYRLYGDGPVLYSALYHLSQKWSIEVLAQ